MAATNQLKVLVSAFNFSPVQGTEFAVGWDYVQAIAARHRVWVIARINEKEETAKYLRANPEATRNITIRYIPFTSTNFSFPFWELPYYRHYRKWQRDALDLARELDAGIDFDLVHHLTGTGFREPGHLWKLGKPFVWGPLGGMQYFPVHLLNAVPLRARPFFLLKNASTFYSIHFGSHPRAAAKHATIIMAATSENAARVKKIWKRDAYVLHGAHCPEPGDRPSRREPDEPFRIVWAGGFQPRKALNLLLLALAELKDTPFKWELHCMGSGHLEPAWKKLAAACGIADRCRFLGWLPREEAMTEMATGHCFAQPTLYDAISVVVMEVLAFGLPVVCLNHCGLGDVIDPDYGVLIAPQSRDQIVRDFASALRMLAEDEDLRHNMALNAYNASAKFTSKAISMRLGEVYEKAYPSQKQAGNVETDVAMGD